MTIPVELKSRKLWIAVFSFMLFYLNGDNAAAASVVLGYFGANVVDKKLQP